MEMIIKALGRNVNPEMQIEEERMSETEKMAVPTQIKSTTRYLAELIGTMVLVLMGCGSAVIAGQYIGYEGIAFVFGLAVLAMVYAIGGVSGCHINPAISISMLVAGKISVKDTCALRCFSMHRSGYWCRHTLWHISRNPDVSYGYN
jgi:predicted membrane channel-forming protein YqfA (hemolysin III family)